MQQQTQQLCVCLIIFFSLNTSLISAEQTLSLEERVRALEERAIRWPKMTGSYFQVQYDDQKGKFSSTQIRRVRLNFDLDITEKIEAEVELALPKNDVNQALEYAFGAYKWNALIKSRIGRFKTNFGLEEPTPVSTLPYIEKAVLSDALSHEIDQGVDYKARLHWINFAVALVNGQNKEAEANHHKDMVGRIGFRPFLQKSELQTLEFGFSNHQGKRREGTGDLNISRIGLDFDWNTERFWTRAEWAMGEGWTKITKTDTKSSGWQIFYVYKIHPRVDLIGMHDRFDPDRNTQDNLSFNSGKNETSRTTLGATYFFNRARWALARLNYEIHGEEEGPSVSNNALRAQFQLKF